MVAAGLTDATVRTPTASLPVGSGNKDGARTAVARGLEATVVDETVEPAVPWVPALPHAENATPIAIVIALVRILSLNLIEQFGEFSMVESLCTTGWSTLSNLSEQWKWLNTIFGDVDEYKSSLCAYYMALNVYEYVDTLKSGNIKALSDGDIHLEILLCYESENDDIKRRAYRLLTSNPEAVLRLWRDRGIDDKIVREHWASWMKVCGTWLGKVYRFGFHRGVSHSKLLDELFGQ